MPLVAGTIAAILLVCLVGFVALTVVMAVVGWIVLKWLVILSAIGGGVLGLLIFGTPEAALGGAFVGVVLSVGGLLLLANRSEARERAEKLAREEAKRAAEEERLRKAAEDSEERRRRRYELLAENPVGRLVKRLMS